MIVIAADSFKGCLSSREVGRAMADSVHEALPECEVFAIPVADGGEGTVEAVVDALGGHVEHASVSDPLGRPVEASYGIAGDLAIIESAAACGLTLLTKEERNPLITSTKGLGELIVAAAGKGCRRFMVGLGGSATNDGGMGMLEADGLMELRSSCSFTVACDVDNPFIGPLGASRVFGPQKGATPDDVEVLEQRLTAIADRIEKETGVDVRTLKGAGAAGGLGGAFKAYLGAELKRGVDMVLDALGFDSIIDGASLVITGEGCSDIQTVHGKTPAGVLARAHARGIPVALVSGAVRDEEVLRAAGFDYIDKVTPDGMTLDEAMKPEVAAANIRLSVQRLLNFI